MGRATNAMMDKLEHIDDDEGTAVTPEELFKLVDKDGSGSVSYEEFVKFHQTVKVSMKIEHKKEAALEKVAKKNAAAAERSRRRLRVACFVVGLLSAFAILLVAVNASLTYQVVEYAKETVADAASGVLAVKGTDGIAKMAEATVAVPLILAPMLPADNINTLKSVVLTRMATDPNTDTIMETQSHYQIIGFDWRSNMSMTFYTNRGTDRLNLHDGVATLHADGTDYAVCAADVSCSAFKMTDITFDVDALYAQAFPEEPAGARRTEETADSVHDKARRILFRGGGMAGGKGGCGGGGGSSGGGGSGNMSPPPSPSPPPPAPPPPPPKPPPPAGTPSVPLGEFHTTTFDPATDGLGVRLDPTWIVNAFSDPLSGDPLVTGLSAADTAELKYRMTQYINATTITRNALVFFSDLILTRITLMGAHKLVLDKQKDGLINATGCYPDGAAYVCSGENGGGDGSGNNNGNGRRQLAHNVPDIPNCMSVSLGSIGLPSTSGAEALSCFLGSIYGHYPFTKKALEGALEAVGFSSIISSQVQALPPRDKGDWTREFAKAFLQNKDILEETNQATEDYYNETELTTNSIDDYTLGGMRRRLQKEEEMDAADGQQRRRLTGGGLVNVTKTMWLESLHLSVHAIHPGMKTGALDLNNYFAWACEYAGKASTCTELLNTEIYGALAEECVYDALIDHCIGCSWCSPPGGPGCLCSGATTTLPSPARRRLDAEGRLLAHAAGNSAGCHPASSTLARCDDDSSPLRLDAARVGDSIRTPSGCEPITGLFHADADAVRAYHQFSTKGGATVAISDDHWLFVNGVEADPATVKVGDLLTTASGKQEAVTRVEREVAEQGAFHIMVASGAYYVDGVVASTYIAHVPLGVWKVFADGYASLRYKMGMPIAPEGQSFLSITWPLAVYDKLGLSSETALQALWPLTTTAAVLTELANTFAVPAFLGAAAMTVAARAKVC